LKRRPQARPSSRLAVFVAAALTLATSVLALQHPQTAQARAPRADLGWYVGSRITTSTNVNKAFSIDQNNGWVVGDGGGLYFTHDGGQTWATKTTSINDNLFDIVFSDAQNGYALGTNVILRTSDGGTNWQVLRPSLPNTISSISAPSASTIYVAAKPNNGPNGVYKSTDSGAS